MLQMPVTRASAASQRVLNAPDSRKTKVNGVNGIATLPDPEVFAKAQRRQFTADYKRRILAEADSTKESGAVGALLRREGLYSLHLTHWRQQRDRGLAPHRRGPKPKHDSLFEEVRKLKQENGQLTQRLATFWRKISGLTGLFS